MKASPGEVMHFRSHMGLSQEGSRSLEGWLEVGGMEQL
jgi:hypothetical protein